jgi:hypothetical protein
MTRDRTDEQVLERARQIDAGRRAGLTDQQIMDLVGARAFWQGNGHVPTRYFTGELLAAVDTAAAMVWDSVFTQVLRREVRKLSDPEPNVTP